MKQFRHIAAATLCVGLVFLLGCSKTQDDSPESRVFGSPPVIETVDVRTTPASRVATCDVTDYFTVLRGFCRDNLDGLCIEDPLTVFTCIGGPNHGGACCINGPIVNGKCPSPDPACVTATFVRDDTPIFDGGGVQLEATYTEVQLDVLVTDPDSIAGSQSDVLLVGASYLTGTPPNQEEETIVLFDDGSSNLFQFAQKATGSGADCTAQGESANCECRLASYDVTSNDPVENDSRFSRGFAFVSSDNLTAFRSNLVLDCIAIGNQQAAAAISGLAGSQRQFRIEAIDRSGNLTEWPNPETVDIGASTLKCKGDPCACCILLAPADPSADEPAGCFGLPGLRTEPTPLIGAWGERCPEGICLNHTCLDLFKGPV